MSDGHHRCWRNIDHGWFRGPPGTECPPCGKARRRAERLAKLPPAEQKRLIASMTANVMAAQDARMGPLR